MFICQLPRELLINFGNQFSRVVGMGAAAFEPPAGWAAKSP